METLNLSHNIYLPHWPLLASCHLRLAHTLVLLFSSNGDQTQLSRALENCQDGINISKKCAHDDPCLMEELLFHSGKALKDCTLHVLYTCMYVGVLALYCVMSSLL